MEAATRPVLEQLKFQTALMKIDLLFEACDRLAAANRQVLYEEMKIRLVKRIVGVELTKHELATDEIGQPLVKAFAELFHGRGRG